MNKISKFFISLSMIVFISFCFCPIAKADIGPKPSISITLENIATDNYLIDLLVYDETGTNFASPLDYNGNGEQYSTLTGYNDLETITIAQLETLHGINYDGWISESTRWDSYLLFADCRGNSEHTHHFGYFGTPDTYRVVIIDNCTGEIKLSDVIHRKDFASSITLDVDTMTTVSKASIGNLFSNIKSFAAVLLLTIAIELIIALLFKIKKIKTIIAANFISNSILQLALMLIPVPYMITFAIMEVMVILAEYFVYSKFFVETAKSKIIAYTITANIVTGLLTFVVI